MTAEEMKIREEERKLMTKIRRRKIKASKKMAAMTSEEFVMYFQKRAEESKAIGLNVVYSLK